jgi:hypothetical protein
VVLIWPECAWAHFRFIQPHGGPLNYQLERLSSPDRKEPHWEAGNCSIYSVSTVYHIASVFNEG